MKIAASILIGVVLFGLIGGLISGVFVIVQWEDSSLGVRIMYGSILIAFILLTFAEMGINLAEIRNAIDLHIKKKIPGRDNPSARQEDKPVITEADKDWECSECGAPLSAAVDICPKCGADVSEIEE